MNTLPSELLILITSFLHPHHAMTLSLTTRRFAFITFDRHSAISHLRLIHVDSTDIEVSALNRNYAIAFIVCYGFTKSIERVGTRMIPLLRIALQHPLCDPAADDNALIKYAAYNGNAQLTSLLLRHPKVDPSADDNFAIRQASRLGHADVVALLLRHPQVDPAAFNNYAIRLACHKGHARVVKVLLESRRVQPGVNGSWPLRTASYRGYGEIVGMLLESGMVDPGARVAAAQKRMSKGLEKPDYATKPMGINNKRKCHDVIFLVLFLVFWCGMWIVANTAIKYGNPAWLLLPIDYHGNRCGTDVTFNGVNLLNLPYLYYTNPVSPTTFPSVCVASCPTATVSPSSSFYICDYGVNPYAGGQSLSSLSSDFTCAAIIIKSQEIAGRCIPNDTSIAFSSKSLTTASNTLQTVIQDVEKCWPLYIGAVFLSLILSFVWCYFLRIAAKPMVWTTVILVNILLGGISLFCYYFWKQKEYLLFESTVPGHDATPVEWEYQTARAGCFLFAALFVICVLLTIFMIKKIRIACEVLKEASTAIGKMPIIIFFPLLLWLASVILLLYFIYILLYIVSINTSVTLSAFNVSMTQTQVNYLLIYHLFGFFWCYAFFQGFNQVTIAGGFATYYWTMDKSQMPPHPVAKSMWRTARYHLGSIALGAFLIAIVQTLRCVMLLFKRLAKKSKLKFLIPLINCCQCYLALLERLVKWINKNGYIMIAIEGKAFCASCGSALALIIRNGLKLVAVDLVGDMIIFISKLCITAMVVLIFYFFINWQSTLITINFIYVPLAVIGIIGLFVSSGFMSVYHLGIDTIFMSFLEDSERNDGSPERPYYMSDALKNIMHVSNKMREEDAKKKTKRVEPMAMEEY
ncbi:hypothetical protein HDU98_010658 [Podochytrium sp. JEL0797]|nr:hypothetical protein HDU98_010658 [Podochytrium sp. JEL0797]